MKSLNNLSPEQLLQQSQSFQQAGKFEEAALGFEKLRTIYPNFPPILNSLGTVYLQQGKLKEGCKFLEKSLSIDANQLMVLRNLALALKSQNQLSESVKYFEKILKLDPKSIDAFNNIGINLQALGKHQEAINAFESAVKINPNTADSHNNLGISLLTNNQPSEAALAFQKAISLNPSSPQLYNNLGLALKKLNKIEESIICFNKAIDIDKRYADAYSNRGLSYQALQQTQAALNDYDECTKLDPGHVDNYWNKSLLKILMGDFEDGWILYEWRWKSFAKKSVRKFNEPLWLGKESIENKKILIYPEQGYGDFIQFCRYIPMIEKLNAEVILEARPALLDLISTTYPHMTIIESGKRLPSFDFQCPIMSLPLAFKTQLDNIPSSAPYLKSDPTKNKKWDTKLGKKTKLRVGLAWSGSIQHPNDHNRNIKLDDLKPILALPFEFHSLQKEYRVNDLTLIKEFGIQNHAEKLNNFSDTTALIENLDLVISVDTAVAHLAGALNKTIWIMLPFNPDYRWMLDKDHSPWYASASLFRQKQTNDWHPVVKSITDKLNKLLTTTN